MKQRRSTNSVRTSVNNSSPKKGQSNVSTGYTLLMLRVEEGNLEEIRLMFERNIVGNVNSRSKTGQTALALAARNGNLPIAEYLVFQGADLNTQNKSGQTPLFIACWFGFYNIVELFLREGADVNLADYRGWTPLMIACYHGYQDIVQLLLQSNADITAIDCFGKKALDRCKDPAIFELLLELEEKLNPYETQFEEKVFIPTPPVSHSRRRTPKKDRYGTGTSSSERERSKEYSVTPDEKCDIHFSLPEHFTPKRSVNQFIHDLDIYKMHERAGYYSHSKRSSRSRGRSRRSGDKNYPEGQYSYDAADDSLRQERKSHSRPFEPVDSNQTEEILIYSSAQAHQSGNLNKKKSSFAEEESLKPASKSLRSSKQAGQETGKSLGSESMKEIKITRQDVEFLLTRNHKQINSKSNANLTSMTKSASRDISKDSGKENSKRVTPPSKRDIIEEDSRDMDIKKALSGYIKDYSSRMDKIVNKKVSYALNFEWKRNAYKIRKTFFEFLVKRAKETSQKLLKKVENNYSDFSQKTNKENDLNQIKKTLELFTKELMGIWDMSKTEAAFEQEEKGLDKILMKTEEVDQSLLADLDDNCEKEIIRADNAMDKEMNSVLKDELQVNVDKVFKSLNNTIARELSKTETLVSRLLKENVKEIFGNLDRNLSKIPNDKMKVYDANLYRQFSEDIDEEIMTPPNMQKLDSGSLIGAQESSRLATSKEGESSQSSKVLQSPKVNDEGKLEARVKENQTRNNQYSMTEGTKDRNAKNKTKQTLTFQRIEPVEFKPKIFQNAKLSNEKWPNKDNFFDEPHRREAGSKEFEGPHVVSVSSNTNVSDFLQVSTSPRDGENKDTIKINSGFEKETNKKNAGSKMLAGDNEEVEEYEEKPQMIIQKEEVPLKVEYQELEEINIPTFGKVEESSQSSNAPGRQNRDSEETIVRRQKESISERTDSVNDKKGTESDQIKVTITQTDSLKTEERQISEENEKRNDRKNEDMVKGENKSKMSKIDSLWQKFGEIVSKPNEVVSEKKDYFPNPNLEGSDPEGEDSWQNTIKPAERKTSNQECLEVRQGTISEIKQQSRKESESTEQGTKRAINSIEGKLEEEVKLNKNTSLEQNKTAKEKVSNQEFSEKRGTLNENYQINSEEYNIQILVENTMSKQERRIEAQSLDSSDIQDSKRNSKIISKENLADEEINVKNEGKSIKEVGDDSMKRSYFESETRDCGETRYMSVTLKDTTQDEFTLGSESKLKEETTPRDSNDENSKNIRSDEKFVRDKNQKLNGRNASQESDTKDLLQRILTPTELEKEEKKIAKISQNESQEDQRTDLSNQKENTKSFKGGQQGKENEENIEYHDFEEDYTEYRDAANKKRENKKENGQEENIVYHDFEDDGIEEKDQKVAQVVEIESISLTKGKRSSFRIQSPNVEEDNQKAETSQSEIIGNEMSTVGKDKIPSDINTQTRNQANKNQIQTSENIKEISSLSSEDIQQSERDLKPKEDEEMKENESKALPVINNDEVAKEVENKSPESSKMTIDQNEDNSDKDTQTKRLLTQTQEFGQEAMQNSQKSQRGNNEINPESNSHSELSETLSNKDSLNLKIEASSKNNYQAGEQINLENQVNEKRQSSGDVSEIQKIQNLFKKIKENDTLNGSDKQSQLKRAKTDQDDQETRRTSLEVGEKRKDEHQSKSSLDSIVVLDVHDLDHHPLILVERDSKGKEPSNKELILKPQIGAETFGEIATPNFQSLNEVNNHVSAQISENDANKQVAVNEKKQIEISEGNKDDEYSYHYDQEQDLSSQDIKKLENQIIIQTPTKENNVNKEDPLLDLLEIANKKIEEHRKLIAESNKVFDQNEIDFIPVRPARSGSVSSSFTVNASHLIPSPTPSRYMKSIRQIQIDHINYTDGYELPGNSNRNRSHSCSSALRNIRSHLGTSDISADQSSRQEIEQASSKSYTLNQDHLNQK